MRLIATRQRWYCFKQDFFNLIALISGRQASHHAEYNSITHNYWVLSHIFAASWLLALVCGRRGHVIHKHQHFKQLAFFQVPTLDLGSSSSKCTKIDTNKYLQTMTQIEYWVWCQKCHGVRALCFNPCPMHLSAHDVKGGTGEKKTCYS
jgi:hypothetical protein